MREKGERAMGIDEKEGWVPDLFERAENV